MRSAGVRVPREEGEATRRGLAERGWLRTDLEIQREEGFLVFPIRGGGDPPVAPGELVEREFAPARSARPTDYRDLLPASAAWRAELPRAFDVVGDIVLIRLPESLDPHAPEIGQALLEFVPSARLVGRDRGVHGADRVRTIERLAGAGGWRTRHRENGIEFDVDVERAYFSPRLAREHERVASDVGDGDEVYDLCCGVGPFALMIARAARATRVTAVDANPAAIELLRATAGRYAFGARIDSVEARIEEFLPSARPVSRVILNLPHEGIKYASLVVRAVAPEGRLYYYEITPRAEFDQRANSIMRTLGAGEWRGLDQHVVHPYAPTADLVAYTFERGGA